MKTKQRPTKSANCEYHKKNNRKRKNKRKIARPSGVSECYSLPHIHGHALGARFGHLLPRYYIGHTTPNAPQAHPPPEVTGYRVTISDTNPHPRPTQNRPKIHPKPPQIPPKTAPKPAPNPPQIPPSRVRPAFDAARPRSAFSSAAALGARAPLLPPYLAWRRGVPPMGRPCGIPPIPALRLRRGWPAERVPSPIAVRGRRRLLPPPPAGAQSLRRLGLRARLRARPHPAPWPGAALCASRTHSGAPPGSGWRGALGAFLLLPRYYILGRYCPPLFFLLLLLYIHSPTRSRSRVKALRGDRLIKPWLFIHSAAFRVIPSKKDRTNT